MLIIFFLSVTPVWALNDSIFFVTTNTCSYAAIERVTQGTPQFLDSSDGTFKDYSAITGTNYEIALTEWPSGKGTGCILSRSDSTPWQAGKYHVYIYDATDSLIAGFTIKVDSRDMITGR